MVKWVSRSTFLLLALALPLGATNGLRQIGYGVKAKGMGGVAIAAPQDAFSVANNPAGLVLVDNRADGGLTWLDQDGKSLFFPEVAARVCRGPREALGFAIFPYGAWRTDDCSYGALLFSPAWSWQINRCHSLGISLSLAFERFDLRNFEPDPSVDPTQATDKGPDYEWGICARFGWIGRFRCLQAGLTFQTPTRFSPLRKYRGFLAGGGQLDLPPELGFGLALFCGPLHLEAEVVELFWHDSRAFRSYSDEPFGADCGPGFGWRNQTVFKFGAAYCLTPCLTLRAGYNHGDLPQSAGNPLNFLTNEGARDHATLGATYSWHCHELSAYYAHGFSTQNAFGLAYAWGFS